MLAGGRVTLTLMIGDVLEVLPQLDARVDAWFLDGFAPSKNPDMWQPPLFEQMARLSAPAPASPLSPARARCGAAWPRPVSRSGKRPATAPSAISVTAGSPRRLTPAGKRLGTPGRARWRERSAIVVGGGLAGAASARSLALRGWQVTLIERMPQLASAASGNPQGVLYTKLSPHLTPLTRLVLSGYAYSLRALRGLLPEDGDWQACGVLQLAHDGKEAEKQQALAELNLPESVMRPLDRDAASKLAGTDLPCGGLFFPRAAGCIRPRWCASWPTTRIS
ncbi:tRNA 5-methylaminomethyl-2-thiouridine biosynthesis bifunctional protein MnmC [Chromobacterium violaceum]|uniref:tRNA 5-methylaminomethyl-2-thiouridine biosynthesis bifunctional protein MnmC n=1 Tax=Chromobacterium violaceum TaxID=536 RepID=A0A447TBQ1_CHRVL|nr:tRNA 5-methylaminomethyl-2-thiouridine biosynthesis bifunctional protein MnmC [Chromobacterium violaceum]